VNKKIISFGSIVFIVLLVIAIILIVGYNSLVDRKEEIVAKESQVLNRLSQRDATIYQLLGAVEGLQEHAENIYEMITDARKAFNDAKAAGDTEGMIEADAMEVKAVRELIIVIEDNPNVNATPAFLTLMDKITANENAISVARKDYNDRVAEYNKSVRKFPTILYAKLFGFEADKPYWKMDGNNEIPKIEFNKND